MLLSKLLDLYVTNDVLLEYEEIISRKYSESVAENFLKTLKEASNVYLTEVHYKFNLIQSDPDDNKFVDCAIAASVDFLITNDKHFNVLKDVPFPKVNITRLEEFEKIINI